MPISRPVLRLRSTRARATRAAGRVLRAQLALLTLLALTLGACSSTPATEAAPGGLAAVPAASAAPAGGSTLDAKAFAAALKVPGTVVLDVRTPAEFADGHLAGATNLDVDAADFADRVGALPKDVPYAVYCRSGNRSATAIAIMGRLGFRTAYHLGGGITAWTAAGGATTKG